MGWGGFTYLATANDQHFLGLDLPGEDEAASALDLWELVLLWTHVASLWPREVVMVLLVCWRGSLVSTVGIGCVTDDLKWPGVGGCSLPVSTIWAQDMKILPGSSLEHLNKMYLYSSKTSLVSLTGGWEGWFFHNPKTQTGCEHDLPYREIVVLIGRGNPCTITQTELTDCLTRIRT